MQVVETKTYTFTDPEDLTKYASLWRAQGHTVQSKKLGWSRWEVVVTKGRGKKASA